MKKIYIGIFTIILLSLFFIYMWLNRPTKYRDDTNVLFTVDSGESAGEIGYKLQKMNMIQSGRYFKLIARITGKSQSLKAGSYVIKPRLKTTQILSLLISGKTQLFPVTIREGLTISAIANIIEKNGIARKQDFIDAAHDVSILSSFGIMANSAEGFLFPDTYYFSKPSTAKQVVTTMLSSFFTQLEKIFPNYKQLDFEKLYDKVRLASIVEKEYRNIDEAPLIASVFYNRLEKNIMLESCATIIYVLTEELGKPHPNRIFFKDLEVDSPFNLYKNKGLTPMPISNPGLVAINAVFNPETTNYLFFVVKDAKAGTHTFSASYADHNYARDLYLSNYFMK